MTKQKKGKFDYFTIKAICVLRKNGFSFYMINKLLKYKDKRNLVWIFNRDKDNFLLPDEEVLKVGKGKNNNKC